jgi:hypothetical protein
LIVEPAVDAVAPAFWGSLVEIVFLTRSQEGSTNQRYSQGHPPSSASTEAEALALSPNLLSGFHTLKIGFC